MSDWSWLEVPAEEAAVRLLGCELVRELDGRQLRARIVETEAYDQDDPASHTHHGRSARNDAMFMAAGHAYVYLIHGIHHCMNVVCGFEGHGCGVLIRAVEPITGLDVMQERRGRGGFELTNGPGKLCKAMDITLPMRGHDLDEPPLTLVRRDPVKREDVVMSTRIGISKNVDAVRRFYLRGNPWVSKPWVREI